MAIDSAAKRFSTMHVFVSGGLVYPTGTIDAAARRDVVWDYRGIAAGSAVAVVTQGGSLRYMPFSDILFDFKMRFVALVCNTMEVA